MNRTTLDKLWQDSEGLPPGFGCRVILANGAPGRSIYLGAGWMWRERSETQHYVSTDGEYNHRRYLPADTVVELVKLP